MAITLNINGSSLLLHVAKMRETYSTTIILKSDFLDKLYFPWIQSWPALKSKNSMLKKGVSINNSGGYFLQADSEKKNQVSQSLSMNNPSGFYPGGL